MKEITKEIEAQMLHQHLIKDKVMGRICGAYFHSDGFSLLYRVRAASKRNNYTI
jgi:hypothetical protein